MASSDVLIQFLCREKLFGALFAECNKLRQKRGDDPFVLFWRSFALGFQGRGSQGDVFQSLESLRNKRDYALAAVHALRFFHRRQARRDEGEIESLDIAAEMTIETANDIALFNAANLLLHIEEHTEALKLLDRMSRSGSLSGNALNVKANTLRGWVELNAGVNPNSPTAMLEVESYFTSSLEADSLNIDAMLGLAKCKYHCQNWDGSLEVLNRAIASSPLMPCLLDKARVMLSKGDWSQASSMAERVLEDDANNIAALRMLALHAATQVPLSALEDGEVTPLCDQLNNLLKAMNKFESHNCYLYLMTGRLFETLMLEPRHKGSLKVILAIVEKAISVLREFPMGTCDDKLSEALCQKGAVLAWSEDARGGMENYREASAVDPANVNALHGMIRCQILLGATNDATEQLDLVKMMSDGEAPDASLLLLEAKLCPDNQSKARYKLLDKASKALRKAIRLTSKDLMGGPVKGEKAVGFCYGEYCLNASDVAMCVEMASLYLKCVESEAVERAGGVLKEIINTSPSLVAAHLLLADVRLRTDPNHPEVALKVLRHSLQMDPSCAQAHLTIASIAIDRMNNLKLTQQSLDHALGVDFSIRNHPTYHLTRAKLLTNQGSPELALKQLGDAKESSTLTQADEVAIAIATVRTLIALRRLSEAKDEVKQARRGFKGSAFEVDVIMAESDLLVARGDADQALRVLNHVPQGSPLFTAAVRMKAKIHLEERRDKVAYTACFSELVQTATSNEAKHDALEQLGTALLGIQNPGKAVEAFQRALELKPSNAMLAVRIGRALIATHDYRRARDYYDAALKSPNLRSEDSVDLQRDLAKLLIKLRKYDAAAALLSADSGNKHRDVDALLLLSDVHTAEVQSCLTHGTDDDGFDDEHDTAVASQNLLDALMRAKQLQQQILSAYSTDSSVAEEDHIAQKTRMALICGKIADFHAKNTGGGKIEAREQLMIQSYREALTADPMSEVSMISLATLFLKRGELELCEEQCETAMRCFGEESTGKQDAALMLADVCFVRKDLEGAMEHLYEVLNKKPNHYDALARLIQLLWRAARMDDEVPKLLRRAEAHSPRSFADPGLNYCKGLYKRLSHDPHGALQLLNLARRDGAWGPASLSLMISVYIEPFLESIYDLASKEDNGAKSSSNKDDSSPKTSKRSSRSSEVNGEESVTIASHLLKELLKMTDSMMKEGGSPSSSVKYGMSCSGGGGIITGASVKRHAVLALRTLIAEVQLANAFVTKNKKVSEGDMEELAQKMVDVLEMDKEFTPAMLALSAMFMLQEQVMISLTHLICILTHHNPCTLLYSPPSLHRIKKPAIC
mmetsp:Transcript_27274/g.32234  ORF Transcript_27274/g.32234 Transcript_27274/m.32234 type:complete len:1320 (+) Transcript_27274:65-4024(+)